MVQATKSSDIGLKMGALLCNLAPDKRLALIADGLPILFDSAASLVAASQALAEHPREANILEGHAQEECAKILILIDVMRCPARQVARRLGPMMRWFYNHLARLIYAEAQMWRPVTLGQLQSYIDDQRRSHYLEGEYGEYIMPNWTLFRRESALYADLAADEDRELSWISPERGSTGLPALIPIAYQVADALSAFGVFTAQGLHILHDVWGAQCLDPDSRWELARDLYRPLAERLEAAGLITARATQDHANALAHHWQLPMYDLDFTQIQVPLDTLLEERDAQYPVW
jgi:hypothetical protein